MSAQERQYEFLRADLAELNNLLSMMPESAVVDRMSLEYRRSQVEAELEAFQPPPRWPATAHLAFNGRPVVDREGIYADFRQRRRERIRQGRDVPGRQPAPGTW